MRTARDNVNSAGIMVFKGRKILMIAMSRNRWSLPKGHIEEGETSEEAAVRETLEETGILAEILPGFSYEVASAAPGDRRTVTYFIGRYDGGDLKPQLSEVRGAAWQDIDEAPSLLRFPEDLPALKAAVDHYTAAFL